MIGISAIALMHIFVAWFQIAIGGIQGYRDGASIVIVVDGYCHDDRIRRLHLHMQEIIAPARQEGLERKEQIQFAVVERNGGVSVVLKQQE